MTPHTFFADAAWFRLGIVGLDILAVILTVRICSAVAALWRVLRSPGRSVPAAAHIARRHHARP